MTQVMQSGAGTLTFGKSLGLGATWIATFVMICNAWGLYCLYNLVPAYLAAPSPMGVGLGPAHRRYDLGGPHPSSASSA